MPVDTARIVERFNAAKGDRSNFEEYWQDAADLVFPARSFTTQYSSGERRNRKIYDSTAPRALVKLSAAIHGLLTNPSTKWFNLRVLDDDLNEDQQVRAWLDDVVLRMLRQFSSTETGFNRSSEEMYKDIIAFGTGVMVIEDKPRMLRFSARPINEIFLIPGEDGEVDSVYRLTKMSVADLVDRKDWKIHPNVTRAFNEGKGHDKQIQVLHAVFPRRDADPFRMDRLNKPFGSVYIDLDNDNQLMWEGGFDQNPYLTPRWSKVTGEVYGRSPTMDNLPDIGMVNAMRRTNIIAAQKAVDPPLIVQANSIEGPINTTSGSIIYTRMGQRDAITPLEHKGRVDVGEALLEKERLGIESGYFLDMLQLPEIDRMTTVEVMQRVQQRMVFMSPVLSRLTSELLGPLVTRTFQAMFRRKMFLPPPPQIGGAELDVDYVSVMALSQRASEATNFLQWMQMMTPLAQVDPSILDRVDIDEVAKVGGMAWFNVPQRLIRSDDDVAAIREQRAQLQQMAAEAQIAETAASAAEKGTKALSNAREVAA